MAIQFRAKNLFSLANIYTAICLLYLVRHVLFGSFSIVGRGLYVLFYLFSIFCFFKAIIEYKLPTCLRMLGYLLALIVFYGLISSAFSGGVIVNNGASGMYFITTHVQSILPIYAYYYFAKTRQIDEAWFRIVALLFFISAYFVFQEAELARLEDTDMEDVVNSAAYIWLALFPIMAFFNKKPLIQYAGLLIIMFFVISGFKRGAIFLAVVCLLFFIWQSMRSAKTSRKIFVTALSGVLLYFVWRYVDNLINSNYLLAARFESTLEMNSSGRDTLYSSYWSFFWNQNNFIAFLFGNGAYGTVKSLGIMAHNDWLEYLIDMGLCGTFFYLLYWVSCGKMCVLSAKMCSNNVFMGITIVLIILFGRSLFSMSIMDMSFYMTSVFGYLIAQYEKES